MTFALSYLRVSSKGQIDGDGFTRQREKIAEYAKHKGLAIAEEFIEEGVSGTTDVISRPALSKLLETVMNDGVTVVLIEKADRLARDLVVSELLLRQFLELGVTVIEAEGGNDLTAATDNPTSVMIRQILGAVAEFEKSALVRKMRQARERKRKETGRCEGNKPYGVLEGEGNIVERICMMKVYGMNTREIADALNLDGVKSRSGGLWNHSVVARIIKSNPTKCEHHEREFASLGETENGKYGNPHEFKH